MFNALSDGFFGSFSRQRAPKLEVIERRAAKRTHANPILFIHGAYAGAWCWDEYFLGYFAEQGFDAYALSVRGHGRSEGREWLHSAGLQDYVDDVAGVVESLEKPPILVGHSMGGMVVQKYLERRTVPAAVLMASVPPSGLGAPTLRLMLGDPWLFVQISVIQGINPSVVDFHTAKRAVFSEDISDAELARYARYFQSESPRALWDMTVAELPRRWRMKLPPLLVLGGEKDVLFTPEMVEETARAYGVKAEIFDKMAHAMMLERGWRRPADRIVEWLAEQGL